VRGVDGEILLGRDQLGDPLRRLVESFGDPVELADAVPAADRAGVTRADPVRRPCQVLHRPYEPSRLRHREWIPQSITIFHAGTAYSPGWPARWGDTGEEIGAICPFERAW
jgi:hypothetical protein